MYKKSVTKGYYIVKEQKKEKKNETTLYFMVVVRWGIFYFFNDCHWTMLPQTRN